MEAKAQKLATDLERYIPELSRMQTINLPPPTGETFLDDQGNIIPRNSTPALDALADFIETGSNFLSPKFQQKYNTSTTMRRPGFVKAMQVLQRATDSDIISVNKTTGKISLSPSKKFGSQLSTASKLSTEKQRLPSDVARNINEFLVGLPGGVNQTDRNAQQRGISMAPRPPTTTHNRGGKRRRSTRRRKTRRRR
jgi:hypothetical protein